jgi:hypothetical protein
MLCELFTEHNLHNSYRVHRYVREFDKCVVGEVVLRRDRDERRMVRNVQGFSQELFLRLCRDTIHLYQVNIRAENTAEKIVRDSVDNDLLRSRSRT